MKRRTAFLFYALLALAATSIFASVCPAAADEIQCPSGVECTTGNGPFQVLQQVEPSYIEHMPLRNFISWEIILKNPGQALTFTGGTVVLRDADGNPVSGPFAYTREEFESLALAYKGPQVSFVPAGCLQAPPCTGVLIAQDTILAVPYPREDLPFNFVPASADMILNFAEYPGEPIEVTGVSLVEYRAPEGSAYSYPLRNHPLWPLVNVHSGNSHELGTPHRLAFNQRYSYDSGYVLGLDPTATYHSGGDENDEYYTWQQPVFAMADGTVDLVVTGHENWLKPGMKPAAGTGPRGGGNIVTIDHGNGEWTFHAHLLAGSNDHIVSGDPILRGEQIGRVGNTGSTSGVPHMHYSSIDRTDPDPITVARSFPSYYNNAVFMTPGHSTARLQLDVAMPTDTILTDVEPPPTPFPRNPPSPEGNAAEVEPNDTRTNHQALSFPPDIVVVGSAEDAEVGDAAVRGDGIEDLFPLDLPAADSLRVELAGVDPAQNADVYLLDSNLRVLNETGEGTAPAGRDELACFDDLEAGIYYVMLSNDDTIKTAATPYELSISSDNQGISVSISNPKQPIPVDGSCSATAEIEIEIHDNCCLNPDDLGLNVVVSNPTQNATLGPWVEDSRVALGPADVRVTGHFEVSSLTSCPALLRIRASAQDCTGHVVDTLTDGGEGLVELIDTMPPVVTSSVSAPRLWPPLHTLVDVGFSREAIDNCDANVAQTLANEAWSDESENAIGDGMTAPDVADLQGSIQLRAERQGTRDGRVYLLISEARDACGNSGFSCSSVGVARARSAKADQLLSAQETAVTQFCEANGGAAPPEFLQQSP